MNDALSTEDAEGSPGAPSARPGRLNCIVLAGGRGQRLGEAGNSRPKALMEVAGEPLLRHVMGQMAAHGVTEFLVAAGHLGEQIRQAAGGWNEWKIEVIDTGLHTATGGRLKRLGPLVAGEEQVLVTYCDGLSDIDVSALLAFHRAHGKRATLAAVQPPSSFGWLELEGDRCSAFIEKPRRLEGWINAGYFAVDPGVFEMIADDATVWERGPLPELARLGELMVYRHHGFWMCVDTVKDIEAADAALARRQEITRV